MFLKMLSILALPVCSFCTQVAHAATVNIHKNESSGLLTWTVKDAGFSIELIQLLPDFVRAIYAKHRFPEPEIERIATYCVFGTIINNTSDQQMSYGVSNWRYRVNDLHGNVTVELPVKTKTQWLQEWQTAGIQFSWTLLPDESVFAIGDWQQGFTTIKLPRETRFDLIYQWELDGVTHKGVLKNLECAPETPPARSN